MIESFYIHYMHGPDCLHCQRLMERAEAKLDRILEFIELETRPMRIDVWRTKKLEAQAQQQLEALYSAELDVKRCKRDLKVEWRERQESWL